MTAETWNIIFVVTVIVLGIIDAIALSVCVSLYKENRKAKKMIYRLISGDNLDMSFETLSLHYHISEERIDQLLTMEKDYERDNNNM